MEHPSAFMETKTRLWNSGKKDDLLEHCPMPIFQSQWSSVMSSHFWNQRDPPGHDQWRQEVTGLEATRFRRARGLPALEHKRRIKNLIIGNNSVLLSICLTNYLWPEAHPSLFMHLFVLLTKPFNMLNFILPNDPPRSIATWRCDWKWHLNSST